MVIIGAGGHAKEVYAVFQLRKEYTPNEISFFDDININRDTIFGIKILHNLNQLNKSDKLVLAVGGTSTRRELFKKFERKGIWINLIAPNSSISKLDVSLGKALNIMQLVMISPSVKIGDGTLINAGVKIHHDVTIGTFCEICPSATVTGGCTIGNEVLIGTGAIILPNIKIGDKAKIGAGAVVTRDIPKGVSVAGIPAKIIK